MDSTTDQSLITMKVLVFVALVGLVASRPDDDYSRYEDFDIDELIGNQRLMASNVKCFLNEGKCTPEGSDIKSWIPEGLQNGCAKCSDKQKVLVARVLKYIRDEMPEDYAKLAKLHNPDGKYDDNIIEFIEKYGN